MEIQHKPLIVKKTKVPELIGMSYAKFSSEGFQEFLKETNFPEQIQVIKGYYFKDVVEWLESINPNRNKKSQVNRSWD